LLPYLWAYFANLIRVVVLYYVGYYYGIEKMMFVHVYLGWIIFIIISFGVMTVLNKRSGGAVGQKLCQLYTVFRNKDITSMLTNKRKKPPYTEMEASPNSLGGQ